MPNPQQPPTTTPTHSLHIGNTRSGNCIHSIRRLYKNGYIWLLVPSKLSHSHTCHKSSTLCDAQSPPNHPTISYISRCSAKYTSPSATTNISALDSCQLSCSRSSGIFRSCWCTSTDPRWCTSMIWSPPSKYASSSRARSARCPSKCRAGTE